MRILVCRDPWMYNGMLKDIQAFMSLSAADFHFEIKENVASVVWEEKSRQ